MDQTRKNLRSTKTNITDETDNSCDIIPHEKCHYCYTDIIEPTGQIYTDQTGKFIQPSSTGNNYVLILYDYDSNAILGEPFKSRRAKDILAAYQTLHAQLCKAGLRPKLQRLDNECSDILKEYMTEQNIEYQ